MENKKTPLISVVAVNYYGDDFKELLLNSLEANTNDFESIEILIHDNSSPANIGHAGGLDKLVADAQGKYIMALDIDSHILLKDWDLKIVKYYEKSGVKLLAGEGGQLKPIRPCVAFFEKDYFLKNKMSFAPKNVDGAKFDVGILFFFQVLSAGGKVEYLKYQKSIYTDVIGNNYKLGDETLAFHHWYGTRWYNVHGKRVHEKIDRVEWPKFEQSKKNLLKQYGIIKTTAKN